MSWKAIAQRKKAIIIILILTLVTALLFVIFNQGRSTELAGKRILLAGDSRSSTDYSFYKGIMEKKTGAIVLVEGASGRTAAYNASDEYIARVTGIEHNYSIWLVGGNDDGSPGSIGTFSSDSALRKMGESVVSETDISRDYQGTSFIQAIDHMMRKYKARYAKVHEGKEPVMIFCTDLPQQRYDQDSPWSSQENWERKRLAIIECCKKNQIACLDLYELCHFDMSIEPMFVPPTDTVNNRGVYYMDGLHPNEKGIDMITNYEIEMIREYLKPE